MPNCNVELVKKFIDSDIAVAEVTDLPNYRLSNFVSNLNRSIKLVGYDDIIKAVQRNGTPYLVNYTLLEEV